MKLSIGNVAIIALTILTLYGAITNPPLPEDQYDRTPYAERSPSEIQPAAESQQAESVLAHNDSLPVDAPLIRTAGQSFIPLREYVRQHEGSLTYNSENDTVDITIGEENFSLLLRDITIMKNGYELPGGFFVYNGTTYISCEVADHLRLASVF